MPKRNTKGFIDPISIIGVLFLIITLVVGTKVTNDRNISLNINEQAKKEEKTGNAAFDKCREESGREVCNERLGINVNWKGEIVNEIDTSKVDKDAPQGQPTCDANGVQYSPGAVVMYGGIGSNATCGADGKWDVGVGATAAIIPENLPEYAKGTPELEKAIEAEIQAAEQLATEQQTVTPQTTITTPTAEPEQIGLTQSTNQTSGTTVIPTVTTVTTSVPSTPKPVISTSSSCGGCSVNETCVSIGYGYYGCQANSTLTQVTAAPVGQPCTNCHLTPTQPTQNSVQPPSQQTVAQVINLMNKDAPIIQTVDIGGKQVTGTVETIKPALLESLKDIGVNLKADITTPDKYAGCTGNACNVTKSVIDDLLINDKYKNYWQEQTAKAKPEDNLLDIAFNQETILDTGDTVFFDKFTPYVANYQRINAETYDPNRNAVVNYLDAYVTGGLDEETRKATVDLGKDITVKLAMAYALPAIAGSSGLLTAAGTTFGQFGAITTSNQIVTATEECIRNGVKDEQCLKDSARAAFSLLTLGTSQAANTITKLAGYSDEAVFLAKGANTVLSGGNLAVDSGDVIDTCTKFGSNQSSFGCTMSYVALVGDIAGGVFDYKQGQLGFPGPKIDVPDINGTRIANAEELALLTKTNLPDAPKANIPLAELPAAKPVKPADVVANVSTENLEPKVFNAIGDNMPKTTEITIPTKITTWWDKKVLNSPVGDFLFGKPVFLDNLDTPLPPIAKGNTPVVIKPVETQAVEIPYSSELDPLIEVKNAWNKYGDRLTTAYNNKDAQSLIDIAKENGYQVKIVPFGKEVDIVEIGGKTTKMPMTKADTVRIGKDSGKKTLFIATTDVSNPTFKIDDLAHDIGAVITDVKFISVEKIFISPYSFADFMTKATGENWKASDIAKNFGTLLNNRTKSVEVPITRITDALTFGEVPSNFLNSVPPPPLTGFAKFMDGSVPTGVGISPLKYVAGGIISAAFLDDYFNWGIGDKIMSLFSTPEITIKEQVQLDNQQKDTQDLKTNVNPVVTTTVAVQPQAENNIQLESIKSGLYAQTDPDIASTLIPGGAGKPFKNIGCGQTTVANILCEYSNYCPTPIEVASMIPLNEYGNGGLTSTQSNIKILNENGFTTDPYRKSLQYHLTEYMEPNDVLWISANVGGIPHHTYLNGYSHDSNGIPVYNLNDSYFGEGFKCKTTSDSSFNCVNDKGEQINIAAENANIYIIDTN
jgi:hypothetical protein